MRFLITILIFLISLNAALQNKKLEELYNKKEYLKACRLAGSIYEKHKNSDEFLLVYAKSCLESDNINRLVLPIIKLYKTKKAVHNSVYFATIFYQKKLLYYALVNGEDISYINLPQTDYILSKIFTKFVKKEYKKDNNIYIFDNIDNDFIYKMYLIEEKGVKKVVVESLKGGKRVDIKKFW